MYPADEGADGQPIKGGKGGRWDLDKSEKATNK